MDYSETVSDTSHRIAKQLALAFHAELERMLHELDISGGMEVSLMDISLPDDHVISRVVVQQGGRTLAIVEALSKDGRYVVQSVKIPPHVIGS